MSGHCCTLLCVSAGLQTLLADAAEQLRVAAEDYEGYAEKAHEHVQVMTVIAGQPDMEANARRGAQLAIDSCNSDWLEATTKARACRALVEQLTRAAGQGATVEH
jgi:hypothetical protein